MSPAVAFAWIVGLALELAGAVTSYHRKLWNLFWLLSFSALASVSGFIVLQLGGRMAYAVWFWIQYPLQYALLLALAFVIACRMIRESNQKTIWSCGVTAGIALTAYVGFFAAQGVGIKGKLLDGEIAADSFLMVILFLGWLETKDKLPSPWGWITAGFIVRMVSDVGCSALWSLGWNWAQSLYAIGEIAALLIWWVGPQWKDLKKPRARARAASAHEDDWILLDS